MFLVKSIILHRFMVPDMNPILSGAFFCAKTGDVGTNCVRDFTITSLEVGSTALFGNGVVGHKMRRFCLKVCLLASRGNVKFDAGHCGLQTIIVALDFWKEVSHTGVLCGNLVLSVLCAALHQDVHVSVLLDKLFQSKITLSPPHTIVKQVVLIFQLLFPFVLSRILDCQSHPCGPASIPALEWLDGGCIWRPPSSLLQKVLHHRVVVSE